MKKLLDEANRMLKTMNPEARQKKVTGKTSEERLLGLQRQLDDLKAVALRPFRLSKLGHASMKGLLDSGATHALRPRRKGESVNHLPKVKVTLAGDREEEMYLNPHGTIIGDEGTEPIIPMGLLASSLHCRIAWAEEGLVIMHPTMGPLNVNIQDGCPVVELKVALELINQLEQKSERVIRSLKTVVSQEVLWLRKFADEHPVFSKLPKHIKDALVELPAENLWKMGNRHRRKLWKKEGLIVHAFSGPEEGYTLKRAFHESGGDKRLLYECDILHGKPEKDLGKDGEGYALLLRAALDGIVRAWVGGPPCRSRSVLRHQEVEGLDMPRPVRGWNGGEFGLPNLTAKEKDMVEGDDILMMRFWFLFAVSEVIRQSEGRERQTGFGMEQPASPEHVPEAVPIWKTTEWKGFEALYRLRTQTFSQSEFGATATKPTTLGGNLLVTPPLPGRKGVARDVAGKSKKQIIEESKNLARWPPAMMRSLAEVIQVKIMQKPIKIRALSWGEHVAAGHTPFRKDCRVCQEAAARDCHHRRSKLPPRVGVLSVDLTGPFKSGKDIQGKEARFLLVGAFTWLAPDQKEEQKDDEEVPEIPEEAPQLEEEEEEEEKKEDEGKPKRGRPRKPEASIFVEGEPKRDAPLALLPQEEEEKEEEREEVNVEVTRMRTPILKKSQALGAIIDFYMRLRADGYIVTQLHTDHGGEFRSEELEKWCRSRSILHTFTPGDQPQTNGRAEVSVQIVKADIRRALHGAQAEFTRWPMAARYVNEKRRLRQIRKEEKTPPFLADVLIRKRYWRAQELQPTQEKAKYIAPSFIHHGHWVERSGGEQVLTKAVMCGLKEPEADEHWIALEDELSPWDQRMRLRGKMAIGQFKVSSDPDSTSLVEEEGNDEDYQERERKIKKVIEDEMQSLVLEDTGAEGEIIDAVAKLREAVVTPKEDQVLQTRMVAQSEIRKNFGDWKEAVNAELTSMFEVKKALRKLSKEEVKEVKDRGDCDTIPSKLVCTLKPDGMLGKGKKKVRLVVCGNHAPDNGEEASDLFAGGISAVSLRVALALASQYEWMASILDIKTAFLNAPMRTTRKNQFGEDEMMKEEKKVLIKPPAILVALGLVEPDELWEAIMAVYGYRQSPRLWSDYRDEELRILPLGDEEHQCQLTQMVTEPNIWKITSGSGAEAKLRGLMLVYVDDIAIFAERKERDLVVEALRKKWETSSPEEVGSEHGVRFLGTELWRISGKEWWCTQQNYTLDLLRRNLGEDSTNWGSRKTPLPKELEPRDDALKSPEAIRTAQKIVGEVVWLSTRARPDIQYAVSRLSSLITRDPELVAEAAVHLWKYLAATWEEGLLFQCDGTEKNLNIATDASFGITAHGCTLIQWGKALLLWRSSKQAVGSISTAEAELIEIVDGAAAGEAVRVVLEEALDLVVRATSFTDSTSAVSIITGESGSWRTRHLRKRAFTLRTKILEGDWAMKHCPGAELAADLGTKVLSADRFENLKEKLGMRVQVKNEEKTRKGRSGGEAERMLKMVILLAKVAIGKAQEEEEWDQFPVKIYRVGGDGLQTTQRMIWLEIVVMVAMLLLAGICIGMLVSNWQYKDYVKVVTWPNRPEFRDRSSVVLYPVESDEEESSATKRGKNQVRKRGSKARPSGPTNAEASASLSTAAGPSGAAAGPSSAAAGSSSAADGSTCAAADGSTGAAATSLSAAAGSSSAADGSTNAAAFIAGGPAAAAASSGAAVRGSRNQPRSSIREPLQLYISPAGERFHCHRECQGLRKAASVSAVPRCAVCGPTEDRPQITLHSVGVGHTIHQERNCPITNDVVKAYSPCQICTRGR